MVPVRNDAKCFVDRVHATTGTNTSDVIERFGLEKLLRMVPGVQLGMPLCDKLKIGFSVAGAVVLVAAIIYTIWYFRRSLCRKTRDAEEVT